VIISTETLTEFNLIKEVSEVLSKEYTVLSLDIKEGTVFSQNPQIQGSNPCLAVKQLSKFVSEAIAIDLGKVGTLESINLELAQSLVECFQGPVIFGGGVKSIDDLLSLRNTGTSGVLLALALHKGTVKIVLQFDSSL